ncbi:MAG: AMP-binding protein [Solirubrobacterales bacterium]|nr:AMP-binding protein [Solirubrobacterales bacterium]
MATAAGVTRTFLGPLERSVSVAAGRTAVACGEVRLTYAELDERVRRLIGALRAMGLSRGDRVGVIGRNCHRYLELYLAVPAGGFVLVPLNARHAEPELRYALADSGTRVLFGDPEHAALAACVERFVALGAESDALLADAAPEPWHPAAEDDLAGLFYTGGTTGAAKGVMLTHGNLVANALAFMTCWPFTPATRWLVVAPMFHAGGTIGVLAIVWAGGQHVILPGFDASAALDAVAREAVTTIFAVPTMLDALVAEQLRRPRDISSVTHLSHGASPIADEVLHRTRKAFPGVSMLHIYGTTETSPIITLLPEEQELLETPRARSCGQPAIGVQLQVVDLARRPLVAGEVGEVRVRGANVTGGYWRKPEQTREALSDGWYLTGDLGYLDEAGHLFLVDRAKDMIITGGENVYSTEVEDALHRHPAVGEAAVFGLPDVRWGEAVHAVVVPALEVGEDELIAHCRTLVAGYKVPKAIHLRAEPLPKSAAGKVLKRELRETYAG